ncbi:MAG: DUF2783 domain-containing protein [Alphaproteobacteria bacterium]|nr:DUF2783 domain-containing protein [Alphaproteobacteria bacterium]
MTKHLSLDANIADADGFYERLIRLHDGLSEAESQLLNAKLVLILANHIGDEQVIAEAMELARKGLGEALTPTT